MSIRFASPGSQAALPVGFPPTSKNMLVMDSANPDTVNYIAIKKEPEEVVPYKGKMFSKGKWGLRPMTEEQKKLMGVEFNGIWCSLTWKDQFGLASIKDYVRAGMPIKFEFENGNKLILTQDNIDAFEAVWLPARMAFFPLD